MYRKFFTSYQIRVSIVVSIPACHAGDRGSIPRHGAFLFIKPCPSLGPQVILSISNLSSVEPLTNLGLGDGFYIESALCAIIGIAWFTIARPRLIKLQSLDPKNWAVPKDIEKLD